MTTAEFDALQKWLEVRREAKEALANDTTASVEIPAPPSAAIETFEGAVHWILSVIWQDSPTFLILGALGLILTVVRITWNTIAHF